MHKIKNLLSLFSPFLNARSDVPIILTYAGCVGVNSYPTVDESLFEIIACTIKCRRFMHCDYNKNIHTFLLAEQHVKGRKSRDQHMHR